MKKRNVAMLAVGIMAMLGVGSATFASTDSLTEWKQEVLQQKKVILDERVKEGVMTQKEADTIYKEIKENQATCDGTGSAAIGKKYGVGFGHGQGRGRGNGQGMGHGRGMGLGIHNNTATSSTSSNQ